MTGEWDVIVAGGGVAGLSAALMLGRARRRVLVVDEGSPRNRFAARMHGVLGDEGGPPAELVERGRAEVAEYGVEIADGRVERVRDSPAGLTAVLAGGRSIAARALVAASGIADRLPEVPGLAARWGKSVLHCPYCHGWEVRDRRIGVLITSPAGLHQAELIRQWSDRVVVFTSGAGGLDPATRARLSARGVELNPSAVVQVLGDGEAIDAVRTEDGVVELDAIFTAGEAVPHDGFLAELGLDRAETPMGSFVAVDHGGRTSHPRVWAVGNLVNPAANVPMSIGAGAGAGANLNMALVAEDFDLAAAAA